jgi:N-acyl-D-amino-acid deacylase
MRPLPLALLGAVAVLAGCRPAPAYDLVIRHGTVYDGSGGEPMVADLAVVGDSIVAVGSRWMPPGSRWRPVSSTC